MTTSNSHQGVTGTAIEDIAIAAIAALGLVIIPILLLRHRRATATEARVFVSHSQTAFQTPSKRTQASRRGDRNDNVGGARFQSNLKSMYFEV